MKKFIKRLLDDQVYRDQFFLIFGSVWACIQAIYYSVVGIFGRQNSYLSWYFGLGIWFGVLFIFKFILLCSSWAMKKGQSHVNYKTLIIVFLAINIAEALTITTIPTFFTTVFASEITGTTFNVISCLFFATSWTKIDRKKLTADEYAFSKSKQYIGRSSGFFTILLLILNIVVLLKDHNIIANNQVAFKYAYLAIGWGFTFYNIGTLVWLCQTKKYRKQKNKK